MNVRLMNTSGDIGETPYITISTGTLAAEAPVTGPLKFQNPANFGISFEPVFYSGSVH